MMIAIATGIEILDKAINERLKGEIIYFREYLIRDENKYETVILSESLDGAITIEELTFKLREKNTRIIYIGKDYEDNPSLIKHLISIGVYDILFGETTIDDVINIYNNPKAFADISKIYSKVLSSPTIQIKSVPEVIIEKEVIEKEKVVEKEKVIEKEKIVEVEKEKIIEVEKPVIIQSKTITFWSYDDGEYPARISIEIAKLLKKYSKTDITLLDFEEISSRISHLLKIKDTNIEYLTRMINTEEITSKILNDNLIKIEGIKVFSGITIKNAFRINDKHLNTLVSILQRDSNFIIINAGSGVFTSGVLSSFTTADKIVAIAKATKIDVIRTLEILNFISNSWGIEKSKMNLLLVENSLISEIDDKTTQELSETNGINFLGACGNKKKYVKNLAKIAPKLISSKGVRED
ncbi:hypothetical protein ACAG39_02000 [Caldicellulosiruptoraceae bacterium PP1]